MQVQQGLTNVVVIRKQAEISSIIILTYYSLIHVPALRPTRLVPRRATHNQ